MMFQEVHASVSFVLSILQLVGQKSQHPRIVSLGEIDVVKPVGAVELLELPLLRYKEMHTDTLDRIRHVSSVQLR